MKNKHAPPFKTAEFELEFGKGICRDSEIIELSCKHKLIMKNGAFYYLNGETLHGKDAMRRYFAENQGVREELVTKLREKLFHSTDKKDDPEGVITDGYVTEETVISDEADEEAIASL